jgi:hypothetical protein
MGFEHHMVTTDFDINTRAREFPALQRLTRRKKNLSGKEAQLQDPTVAIKGLL